MYVLVKLLPQGYHLYIEILVIFTVVAMSVVRVMAKQLLLHVQTQTPISHNTWITVHLAVLLLSQLIRPVEEVKS